MQYSAEQIIRAHASAGIEALAYIKELETRLKLVNGVINDFLVKMGAPPMDDSAFTDAVLLQEIIKQDEENAKNFPTIVCLCGSTRFSEAFHEANLRETLAGRIVLSIGCDFKSDTDLQLAGQLTDEDKTRLDELHLRKIDLADEILVLNVGGYVGKSTAREIAYALDHGKHVRWLESGFQQHSLEEFS